MEENKFMYFFFPEESESHELHFLKMNFCVC